MDITERKITKIAREVSKFTVRTLRAEGIGPGKFDVLHAIRKTPASRNRACAASRALTRAPSRRSFMTGCSACCTM